MIYETLNYLPKIFDWNDFLSKFNLLLNSFNLQSEFNCVKGISSHDIDIRICVAN